MDECTILYISNNTKSILFSAVFIIFLFGVSLYFILFFFLFSSSSLGFPFVSMFLCAPRSGFVFYYTRLHAQDRPILGK